MADAAITTQNVSFLYIAIKSTFPFMEEKINKNLGTCMLFYFFSKFYFKTQSHLAVVIVIIVHFSHRCGFPRINIRHTCERKNEDTQTQSKSRDLYQKVKRGVIFRWRKKNTYTMKWNEICAWDSKCYSEVFITYELTLCVSWFRIINRFKSSKNLYINL